MPRGKGVRCTGILSDDGRWARCSREEHAGSVPLDERTTPAAYVHHIGGPCACGVVHQVAQPVRNGHVNRRGSGGRLGREVERYVYTDEQGHPLYCNVRYTPKDFRQQRWNGGEWVWGTAGVRRVPYRLPELLAGIAKTPEGIVYSCEGEADADYLRNEHGLTATSPPEPGRGGGGWAVETAAPLRGQRVVILVDNDPEGEAGSAKAEAEQRRAGADARRLRLPNLGPSEDVRDWLRAGRTLAELQALAEALWQPTQGTVLVHPAAAMGESAEEELLPDFPLEALPSVLRAFVTEEARAAIVAPDMVAVPALACAGAAIGTSRAILLKPGWAELPTIWAAVVAPPGAAGTPVLSAVCAPLDRREDDEMVSYRAALAQWEEDEAAWEAKSAKSERGARPKAPVCVRRTVNDVTMEKLAELLQQNPRGLLYFRDELTGWVRSMDQYKARGRGADRSHWLSIWSSRSTLVDRKSSPEPCYLRRPLVCVTGKLQTDMLSEMVDAEGRDDGFVDRLVMVRPRVPERYWTEESVTRPTEVAYHNLFGDLLALTPQQVDESRSDPRTVPLDPEAKSLWVELYNQHVTEMGNPALPIRLLGPWAKFISYAARLALVDHEIRVASKEVEHARTGAVGVVSVVSAWAIVDYLKAHARALRRLVHGRPEDRAVEAVVTWLRRRGGSATRREMVRSEVGGVRSAKEADALIARLAEAEYGHRQVETVAGGQVVRFTLDLVAHHEEMGAGVG
jgi:Protein of unknown function (DUF3987)